MRTPKGYEKTWTEVEFTFRRLHIRFTHRSAANFMGRFGGGWNWKVGVQWSGSCVLFSLLVCELKFSLK